MISHQFRKCSVDIIARNIHAAYKRSFPVDYHDLAMIPQVGGCSERNVENRLKYSKLASSLQEWIEEATRRRHRTQPIN